MHLDALRGNVDLLFALAGAHATIALDNLDAAISAILSRAIIPMHYYSPRWALNILPVDNFPTVIRPVYHPAWQAQPRADAQVAPLKAAYQCIRTIALMIRALLGPFVCGYACKSRSLKPDLRRAFAVTAARITGSSNHTSMRARARVRPV